ncbi:TAXI family TRAP transporter solute-binding subunit [Rhodococcus sp. T2V]|uniref:TAXI family TRAP transporter solute-binding subunit n=1 Tax=Rhodococcus sp. T2V TaxID=3034164 RepID=UPI0023E1F553|nr:TAXI family TRAP transporter solute-binding subunit [Rhodococcus sp. T2V]MDF3310791.1 TAXI family TRAP transporter solute-binding subunit [Rhodococcus sp. T2V]
MINRRQFLGGVAAAVALSGCARTQPSGTYEIASGERDGFQSEFAELLADTAATESGDLRFTVRYTTGSLENLSLLASGEVLIGLTLADSAVLSDTPMLAIGRVYENYLQCAVPARSPFRSMKDLREQTISLGSPGSGTAQTGRRVLEASGLTVDDVTVRPVSLTTVLDSLADGTVAAALWAGGVPTPAAVPRPGHGPDGGIRLLDLSAEYVEMRRVYGPMYEPVSVPAGAYGDTAETATVGVPSLLVASPQLPDVVAGALVDLLVDRAQDLIPPDTVGAQFLDVRSLIQTAGVPRHPGAVAAYRRHHG